MRNHQPIIVALIFVLVLLSGFAVAGPTLSAPLVPAPELQATTAPTSTSAPTVAATMAPTTAATMAPTIAPTAASTAAPTTTITSTTPTTGTVASWDLSITQNNQKTHKNGFYHDGRYATLADVVNHYNDFLKLNLTDAEKKDLIEFLKSL